MNLLLLLLRRLLLLLPLHVVGPSRLYFCQLERRNKFEALCLAFASACPTERVTALLAYLLILLGPQL